jgi:hypothetical protein
MNFLIAGYGYSNGGVATDASIPLEDARITINYAVLAYARSLSVFGKSGKVDVIVPYGWLDGSAQFNGQPRERVVDGLIDPKFRFSVNLYGAPALSLEDWVNYHQDVIIGASLQVSVPVGQYHSDKLVNLGSNRWFFKPEVGISKAWGPAIFELTGAAAIFTDNQDFLDRTREQDPILSVQGHFIYTFWHNAWAAFDVTYYAGGRSTVDGDQKDDRQSNTRLGLTLAAPVSKQNSIKLYGSTAVQTRTGTDFDAVGVAWQYRWGGGL